MDDADRVHFVERLATVLAESATSGLARMLISKHFHRLVRTGSVLVATGMRGMSIGAIAATGICLTTAINLCYANNIHIFLGLCSLFTGIRCERRSYPI